MTAAIYTRVSTRSQDAAAQRQELEAWVRDREARWFTDSYTGTTMNRPGWTSLWSACKNGQFDTVVVWRLDRLGRTARGLLELRDDLAAYHINLISLRDAIDLSTPSGRLMFTVIASIAEYETEVRRERQTVGIERVRDQNAGRCPWGGRARGTLNRRTMDRLDAVRALHSNGVPSTSISRITGLSRSTVGRLLSKETA